ncbi:expressed unknown protein [Seminavis robusta]|uniref:Uncharacterized protein n=1 Tax=Seminavis robusta TaxID=568900 RepID=A0A9N8H4K0_9STRA|nr:expressed unknown protein [Seminavis robusta]|eukprot:Sro116_g057210.1 n/a (184) ;mRNA; r:107102-107653
MTTPMFHVFSSMNDLANAQHHKKSAGHRRSHSSPEAVVLLRDDSLLQQQQLPHQDFPSLVVDRTPDSFFYDYYDGEQPENDDEPELIPVITRQKAHSFHGEQHHPEMPQHPKRAGSCPPEFFYTDGEKDLQQRRDNVSTNLKRLYDDRKEHIFELFQDTWIISDDLEDESDGMDIEFFTNRAA